MLRIVMEDWKTVDDNSEKYFPSQNIEKFDCVKNQFTSATSQFYLHYDKEEEEEEEEKKKKEKKKKKKKKKFFVCTHRRSNVNIYRHA